MCIQQRLYPLQQHLWSLPSTCNQQCACKHLVEQHSGALVQLTPVQLIGHNFNRVYVAIQVPAWRRFADDRPIDTEVQK
jgi:hypothetical protein